MHCKHVCLNCNHDCPPVLLLSPGGFLRVPLCSAWHDVQPNSGVMTARRGVGWGEVVASWVTGGSVIGQAWRKGRAAEVVGGLS
jgi:hypothetical protein